MHLNQASNKLLAMTKAFFIPSNVATHYFKKFSYVLKLIIQLHLVKHDIAILIVQQKAQSHISMLLDIVSY